MVTVRTLLARVARLERADAPAVSPFEKGYGSVEAFAGSVRAGIDGGYLDSRDGPVVLAAVRRWHNDRVWDVWQ